MIDLTTPWLGASTGEETQTWFLGAILPIGSIELGDGALSVSGLGFGCGGLLQSPSRKERMAVLGCAVDSGITHFDTARMYGLGAAEAELGVFLRSVRRESVTVATKFGIDVGRVSQLVGRHQAPVRAVLRKLPAMRRTVRRGFALGPRTPRVYDAANAGRSLDESLRALGSDYIDILFLHGPRKGDFIATDELLGFFETAKRKGKIRAWGVSQDDDLDLDFSANLGTGAVRQCRWHLPNPTPQADLLFGVLSVLYQTLSNALESNSALTGTWRKALGLDPLAPGALPRLILGASLLTAGHRCVLYSSTNHRRVADAAAVASSPPDPETLARFQSLLQDFQSGNET